MMHLTRAVLNRNAGVGSIVPLLNPADPNQALDAHHRLIWTLFPDSEATRDFLWRSDGSGRFYILSHRKPVQSGLFLTLESTEFSPVLAQGDRLAFTLRANATRDRRMEKCGDGRRRSRRVDLVMDALYSVPGQKTLGPDQVSDRPRMRMRIADRVANEWLTAIGDRAGFDIEKLQVDDYSVRQFRRPGGSLVTFGLLDMKGVLLINQPDPFLAALTSGFGRARAFGCGLMLIRRA
ncbi:MAG: type I-E CRISPR-associated protein Cas6/Cse3/CasE [Gammaproteobacteria bacterium]|nr:type I-E CRISPR-associated protein Cas6/Cse3/CasE [Gammaproteobacteria bacterium]